MAFKKEKLSVGEKLGYSAGDMAANFIFQTILIFQLSFYTDTFGITAAAAGTMFLVVRFSDAITDPIMGIIADRTNSRWGKFRPWIIFTAVPFGALAVITFTTPDLGPTGKLVYAYVTYTIMMIAYTANNLPYSALSGVMTGDPIERTKLSSYRFMAMTAAAIMIQGLALPMVNYFGRGDDALGYQITIAIFATLGVILFAITFFSTKERITPPPKQKSSIRQDFGDLVHNGPWKAMFVLTIFIFITLAMRGSVMVYYFRHYVEQEGLFSFFMVSGLLATVVGIILASKMTALFGKRNVFAVAIMITALFTGAFYFLPPHAIEAMFAFEILRQLAYGFTIPLLWAMMGDVADYSEWKNHRRATGVVFSAVVFGLKAGLGFGGALAGWLLAAYGYEANVPQTAQAIQGIIMTSSIYPAITFIIAGACLYFYEIDKNMEKNMTDQLELRRQNNHEG